MPAFAPYRKPDRLESIPILADFKSYGNLTLLLTCGARTVFESIDLKRSGQPEPRRSVIFTLPDGRLNAGVHLPLLAHRYRYLSALGEGASAQVLLVEDTLLPDRELKAIKVLKRQHSYLGRREIRALRYLQARAGQGTFCPSMVSLTDTFMLGGHCCLVTNQLFPRLLDWVAQTVPRSKASFIGEVRKFAYQLLSTVAFMHACGVVHADIKPDNILMAKPDYGMKVSLVDFGGVLSITETDLQQIVTEVQTLPYRAPEVALGTCFGHLIDEWSVGVVLAETALKRPLFPQSATPIELLTSVVAQLGPVPPTMIEASDLARSYDLASLLKVNSSPSKSTLMMPTKHRQRRNLSRHTLESLCASSLKRYGQPDCTVDTWNLLFDDLSQVDALFADLVLRLLAYEPAERIAAKDALQHSFFHPLKGFEVAWLTEPEETRQINTREAPCLERSRQVKSEDCLNDITADVGVAGSIEQSKVVDRTYDDINRNIIASKLNSVEATDTNANESFGQTSNSAKKKPRRDAVRESRRSTSKPWWVV
jgi:serine/threonine protein kinase